MTIKRLILCCVIFSYLNSQSQSKGYCGVIEYTIAKNIAYDYKEDYKMIFNDIASYSEEINIDKSKAELVKDNVEGMLTNKIINGRKNETPAFYYNNKENFYFSEIWDNAVIVVKENQFDWNWKLHSEIKNIGNFQCQKASIKFRGRNYIAWFTSQIPVKYGPWKFQGLSGLILEVYDENYYLHITTSSIKIDQSNDCPITFNPVVLKDAFTIGEYRKKIIDLAKEQFARISSKFPKGTPPLILDENCEDCDSGRIEIFDEKK